MSTCWSAVTARKPCLHAWPACCAPTCTTPTAAMALWGIYGKAGSRVRWWRQRRISSVVPAISSGIHSWPGWCRSFGFIPGPARRRMPWARPIRSCPTTSGTATWAATTHSGSSAGVSFCGGTTRVRRRFAAPIGLQVMMPSGVGCSAKRRGQRGASVVPGKDRPAHKGFFPNCMAMNTIRKLSLGSTISKRNTSTGELWTFGYDNDNRMLTAKDVSGAGATLTLATYTYDVFGNRIESDVWTQSSGTTTVTRFGYDGDQVWADLASNNSLQMRYLRGDEADQLFGRISGAGVAAWYLTDWEGSVRNLTDNSGNLTDTIAYGGFGDIQSESNATVGGAYKFGGMRYDTETGLYHADDRTGAPTDGRWVQEDPEGFAAGDTNLYRYVGNAPTDALDPTGLASEGFPYGDKLDVSSDWKRNEATLDWFYDSSTAAARKAYQSYLKTGRIADMPGQEGFITASIKLKTIPMYVSRAGSEDDSYPLQVFEITVTDDSWNRPCFTSPGEPGPAEGHFDDISKGNTYFVIFEPGRVDVSQSFGTARHQALDKGRKEFTTHTATWSWMDAPQSLAREIKPSYVTIALVVQGQ